MPHTRNPGHLTKHFNTQICEAFAADLGKYNEKGLSDEAREASERWLGDIVTAASMIPDGGLRGKSIRERCEAIAAEYSQWNSGNSTLEDRAAHQLRMKRKADKVGRTYRHRTKLVEQKVDPGTYLAFYQATEKLVGELADTLPAVAHTFAKYPKVSRQPTQ
jgi:hypothetical protein